MDLGESFWVVKLHYKYHSASYGYQTKWGAWLGGLVQAFHMWRRGSGFPKKITVQWRHYGEF